MPTWRLTVTVTDPGTRVVYYKSPAAVARYAEPTATGRLAIRYNPGHRCHHRGALSGQHPDLAAARAAGDRPWRRGVPVSTYRSGVRYDVTPGQLGRPVATFEAMTAGQYQVSVTRATEAGATLAAGDNFASDIAAATVGAAILGW
jgi:hypothetical protein